MFPPRCKEKTRCSSRCERITISSRALCFTVFYGRLWRQTADGMSASTNKEAETRRVFIVCAIAVPGPAAPRGKRHRLEDVRQAANLRGAFGKQRAGDVRTILLKTSRPHLKRRQTSFAIWRNAIRSSLPELFFKAWPTDFSVIMRSAYLPKWLLTADSTSRQFLLTKYQDTSGIKRIHA